MRDTEFAEFVTLAIESLKEETRKLNIEYFYIADWYNSQSAFCVLKELYIAALTNQKGGVGYEKLYIMQSWR